LGRGVAGLSRGLGRGEGSVIGGRVTLALDPRALERLAAGRRGALVSGTNGKTTTTRLLAAALATAGPVATNTAGANLLSGLVTSLGDTSCPTAALEVDEGLLPAAVDVLRPDAVALLNLSRDQLDRIGEVRIHAQRWRRALELSADTAAVANADDPLVVWAAEASARVTWIGTGQRWRLDAASCPACSGRIAWPDDDAAEGWACRSCELRRPTPDARLDGAALVTPDARRLPVRLQLPGRA